MYINVYIFRSYDLHLLFKKRQYYIGKLKKDLNSKKSSIFDKKINHVSLFFPIRISIIISISEYRKVT